MWFIRAKILACISGRGEQSAFMKSTQAEIVLLADFAAGGIPQASENLEAAVQ